MARALQLTRVDVRVASARAVGRTAMEKRENPRDPEQDGRSERPADNTLVALLSDVGSLALSFARLHEGRTRPARRGRLHFV